MKANKRASFKAMARLLPEDQREHFFETISKFEVVPDDDEYLLLLESLGFVTLVFDKIPERIEGALDRVESGLNDKQFQSLQRRFEAILKNSIDTPSYKDLRAMVREMEEVQQQFKMNASGLSNDMAMIPSVPRPGTFGYKALIWGCVLSLVAGAVVAVSALLTKYPGDSLNFSFRPKQDHDDYVDYFEDYIPEFGGFVGIYAVKGEVLTTTEQDNRGVVIVKLPNQPAP